MSTKSYIFIERNWIVFDASVFEAEEVHNLISHICKNLHMNKHNFCCMPIEIILFVNYDQKLFNCLTLRDVRWCKRGHKIVIWMTIFESATKRKSHSFMGIHGDLCSFWKCRRNLKTYLKIAQQWYDPSVLFWLRIPFTKYK